MILGVRVSESGACEGVGDREDGLVIPNVGGEEGVQPLASDVVRMWVWDRISVFSGVGGL